MVGIAFAITLAIPPATWIVDAANGVGTNFLDLPAAVGEVTVPLDSAQYFWLDGSGSWSTTFTPALATPSALGRPAYFQAGVFDGLRIRTSAREVRIFSN